VNPDDWPSSADPADAVLQLFATALASRFAFGNTSQDESLQPMLTVAQTAAYLGISRMTVTRLADAGELPCVVISGGKQRKIRRFPRKLIEDLALGKGFNTGAEDSAASKALPFLDR